MYTTVLQVGIPINVSFEPFSPRKNSSCVLCGKKIIYPRTQFEDATIPYRLYTLWMVHRHNQLLPLFFINWLFPITIFIEKTSYPRLYRRQNYDESKFVFSTDSVTIKKFQIRSSETSEKFKLSVYRNEFLKTIIFSPTSIKIL